MAPIDFFLSECYKNKMIYLYAMLITAVAETIFFWLCRYRKADFLVYVFFLNLATNFVVNQLFRYYYPIYADYKYTLIFVLELGVFLSEFAALSLYTGRWSLRLAMWVFLANLMTWGGGEIYFRFWAG